MRFIIMFILLLISCATLANSLPDHRHIAITGFAEIKVKPDIAILHLAVESTQKQSIDAKVVVDKRFSDLLSKLKPFNIKDQDIVASRLSTSPHYEYSRHDNKHVLTGFTARRNFKVTLADLTQLSDIMDLVLSSEINQIQNIELAYSDEENIKQQAIELAIKDAKTNAAKLAQSFGATLGDIYSIDAQSHQRLYGHKKIDTRERIGMISSETGSFTPTGTYLQENLTFNASINVVFDLTTHK